MFFIIHKVVFVMTSTQMHGFLSFYFEKVNSYHK